MARSGHDHLDMAQVPGTPAMAACCQIEQPGRQAGPPAHVAGDAPNAVARGAVAGARGHAVSGLPVGGMHAVAPWEKVGFCGVFGRAQRTAKVLPLRLAC